MPTREEWANFQAIAGLHLAWRHPLVRPVVISATAKKLAGPRSDLLDALRLCLVCKFGPDWERALMIEYIRAKIIRPMLCSAEFQCVLKGLPGVHHGFQAHRQHNAPPAHQPRPGAADDGQGARLPVAWPGAVKTDGGVCVHGRTIAERIAEAI